MLIQRNHIYVVIMKSRNHIRQKVRKKMADCRYCANVDVCQYIVAPDDCEDFEETFEHHWEMMDDIEREEYSSYDAESEE